MQVHRRQLWLTELCRLCYHLARPVGVRKDFPFPQYVYWKGLWSRWLCPQWRPKKIFTTHKLPTCCRVGRCITNYSLQLACMNACAKGQLEHYARRSSTKIKVWQITNMTCGMSDTRTSLNFTVNIKKKTNIK